MPDDPSRLTAHHLFPSVAYTTVFDQLRDVRDDLINDVVGLADDEGVGVGVGVANRTPTFLHERQEPHWRRYFEALDAMVGEVAQSLHPQWTSLSQHSWGLVFRSRAAWPSNFTSLHAHAQATFSSVCYLSVPKELSDIEAGGTLIRNPLANIHHRYYDVDYVRFEPVELGVVVFPGFLEHLPERPPPGPPLSVPRVVVATDYCYY